jgi:hypothetical protein
MRPPPSIAHDGGGQGRLMPAQFKDYYATLGVSRDASA